MTIVGFATAMFTHQGATFSEDRVYRYHLWRTWDREKPKCTFVLLNPSTADETKDDPTVRRCIAYAKRWGYGALCVVNIFALRSTDPGQLVKVDDPIGPDNDVAIKDACLWADMVVFAWGNHGLLHGRWNRIFALAHLGIMDPHVLRLNGVTKQPAHPLYLPGHLKPIPLREALAA